MDIKLGRNGKFLSCSKYPDCEGALTLDGHEFKKDEPIGTDPETRLPIFVLNGRFGPYVQLGVKEARKSKVKSQKSKLQPVTSPQLPAPSYQPPVTKPRMASIPKNTDLAKITVTDALRYLSIPRKLGTDPATGLEVTASIGRFGPYVVRDGDYRSIKPPLDIYEITLEQALGLLAQEKKPRGFTKKKKVE